MQFSALVFAIFCSLCTGTVAYYACVCNDQVYSVKVYQEAKNTSSIIGHIDHTQCKQEICDVGHNAWIKVEYETQFGYVDRTAWIRHRMCAGNQPVKTTATCDTITDLVTTPRPSSIGTTADLKPATTNPQTPRPSTAPSNMTDGNLDICPSTLRYGAITYNVILGQHGTKCYTIDTHHMVSWQHAEEMCASHGGHLVHIQNEDEQRFVASFVARHSPHMDVWIGLHDMVKEGVYYWTDTAMLSYSNWKPHHLNAATHHLDDCVVMRHDGYWDDVTCGHRGFFGDRGHMLPYICQFEYPHSGLLGLIG